MAHKNTGTIFSSSVPSQSAGGERGRAGGDHPAEAGRGGGEEDGGGRSVSLVHVHVSHTVVIAIRNLNQFNGSTVFCLMLIGP